MKLVGKVESVGRGHARVLPLAEVTNGAWRKVEPAEFPKEGRVFWPDAQRGIAGALIFFAVEKNRSGDRQSWNHTFQVVTPEPAIEIVDLRKFGTIEDVRRAIVAGSVPRSRLGRLLIRSDDHLVGPVWVDSEKRSFSLEGDGLEHLPAYKDSDVPIHRVEDDRGQMREVVIEPIEAMPALLVAWDADEAVVRRVLRTVQFDGLEAPPELLERLVKTVTASGSSLESSLKRYEFERALGLLKDADQLKGHSRAFSAALAAHPSIAQPLLTASVRRSLEATVRDELRAELGVVDERLELAQRDLATTEKRLVTARAELDQRRTELQNLETEVTNRVREMLTRPSALLAEVTMVRALLPDPSASVVVSAPKRLAAQQELTDIEHRLAVASLELERRREELQNLDASVAERMREMLAKPSSLLAEVAIVRALLPESAPLPQRTQDVPIAADAASREPKPARASVRPPKGGAGVPWLRARKEVSEPSRFRQALNASFKARGVVPACSMRIHAAFVAGLMPIVTGPVALSALEAYAIVACGARRLAIHVTPTMLETTDLFGKDEAGHFVAYPAGLVEVLQTVHESGETGVLVLEGINRGPTEAFLVPLLTSIAARLDLARFHSTVAAWPSKLLLAATTVEGSTTLPLSRDILAHAVVIEATAGEATATSIEASDIDKSSDLLVVGTLHEEVLEPLLELPEVDLVRPTLRRFGAALQRFDTDAASIRTALCEHVLLPAVITLSNDEEREESLAKVLAAIGTEESERLVALARRLRRRIA